MRPLMQEAVSSHPLGSHQQKGTVSASPVEKAKLKKGSQRSEAGFVDPLSLLLAADDALGPQEAPQGEECMHGKAETGSGPVAVAEEFWQELSSRALREGSAFKGKVQIPEALHFLMESLQLVADPKSQQARLDLLEGRPADYDPERDGLGHQDMVNFVELVNNQLAKHWKDDKRVAVVRLTIQIAKMLAEPDPRTLKYYPCLFFMLSDLITYFGLLVYDRLVSKCPGLRVNFTHEDVSEHAQELAKNWLMKIVSIRELVPRIYLETAFLKCYRFLNEPEQSYTSILERLTLSIRGIADPLVAAYARVFLLRMTEQALGAIAPELPHNVARQNYEEFLSLYKHQHGTTEQVQEFSAPKTLHGCNITDYLLLLSIPIQWLLEGQQFGLSAQSDKDNVIKRCINEVDNARHSSMIYEHLIRAASSDLILDQINHLNHLVSKCSATSSQSPVIAGQYPAYLLIAEYGRAVLGVKNKLTKPQRLNVFNSTWAAIKLIADEAHFLECSVIWIQFAALHFSASEVDNSLGDVARKLSTCKDLSLDLNLYTLDESKLGSSRKQISHSRNSNSENILQALRFVLFQSALDFFCALSLSNFNLLFELMETRHREALATDVLDRVEKERKKSFGMAVNDTVSIGVLNVMCEVLANSITVLTIEDDRRQISQMISNIVFMLDFGDDFESHLTFLSENRHKFFQLDLVQQQLIHRALQMTVRANTSSCFYATDKERKHEFLQACLAFIYVSIPAIQDVFLRTKFFLSSVQISYLCSCPSHGDAFVEKAIEAIESAGHQISNGSLKPRSVMESRLVESYQQLFNVLLLAPDVNEAPLSWFKSATNSTDSVFSQELEGRPLVFVEALNCLIAMQKGELTFEIVEHCDNSRLHYGNEDYSKELREQSALFATRAFMALSGLTSHSSGAGRSHKNVHVRLQAALERAHVVFGPDDRFASIASQLRNLNTMVNSPA